MDTASHPEAPDRPAPLDVQGNLLSRLDIIPLTRSMWIAIALIIAVWIVESFDQGIVGTTVITVTKPLRVTPAQIGLYAISSTVGVAIGAWGSGPLVDRWGRRTC